jgi:cytidylate kinase
MLLILTGPPGAGKTTIGAIIASESPQSACIHSDWFWTTMVREELAACRAPVHYAVLRPDCDTSSASRQATCASLPWISNTTFSRRDGSH